MAAAPQDGGSQTVMAEIKNVGPITSQAVVRIGGTDITDIGYNAPTSYWGPVSFEAFGFDAAEVELVRRRLEGTHWKRRLPTVALLSATAIGESYLRPVDY
mgnify:CR=1 FL=1